MSRLMVCNLPKYYTETKLKEFFSSEGTVTDSKIIRLKDGTSRRFGFVGYKNKQDADKALKKFNNTYIDICKIKVERAVKYGDEIGHEVWSKHTKAKLRESNKNIEKQVKVSPQKDLKEAISLQIEKKKKILQSLYELEQDPEARVLLDAIKSKKSKPSWADDVQNTNSNNNPPLKKLKKATVLAVPNKKPGGEGLLVTKSHVKFVASDSDSSDEYQDLPNHNLPDSNKASESADNEERQNITSSSQEEEHVPDDIDSKHDSLSFDGNSAQKPLLQGIILRTGRLFISNITFLCTEEELSKYFGKYGPISETHIILDKKTKKSTGMAFVQFAHSEHALRAFSELDKSIFQGRIIHIEPGLERPKNPDTYNSKTFKNSRLEKLKSLSEKSFNWATFFMSSDAIAEAASSKIGISKGELLNPESEDVAIRLTLAETSIIQEAKQYLSKNGVNLEAIESQQNKHSLHKGNTIIVKNLPAKTNKDELYVLFSKYGTITKLIIPPSATIAIVSFMNNQESKNAFSKLAYSQYKQTPLFIEWAPENIFMLNTPPQIEPLPDEAETIEGSVASASTPNNNSKILQEIHTDVIEKNKTHDENVKIEEEEYVPSYTLYVTNLNFKTTQIDLKNSLKHIPGVRSVKIATKQNNKTMSVMSMGFGFVEFESQELAEKAFLSLNNFTLDEHKLVFKLSRNTKVPKISTETDSEDCKTPESNKILVKNIPFQASKREVRELFKTFGDVRSLRMPKKFDGQHRGFCFVHYFTKKDALHAFSSLKFTHFYGRHLVIEWANDSNDIEELRKKTASSFALHPQNTGQNRKKRLDSLGHDNFD